MGAIKNWYDGYQWGGPTRVLNPYSILHFFNECNFDNYWIQSGRPSHLTALIKANPIEYIEPELRSESPREIRSSDLNGLRALPILFHSGYLTVDKIKLTDIECLKTEDLPLVRSYTFRYPNYEVSTSYKSDVCSVLFNTEPNALMTDGAGLLNALLGKDARTIETIFGKLFTRIISHQRPKDEKTFRAFVRLVMAAAGLKVRGEPPGAKMRPDCLVELEDRVYVIIGAKFCQNPSTRLMPAERNSALAYLATTELSPQIVGEYLAKSPLRAEYYSEIYKVLKQNENESSTKEDRISLIAKTVMSLAPAKAIDEALASLAVKTFSREKIEEAFNGLSFSEREPTPEKIDELLAVGVKKALIDINDKGYRKLVENGAKGIIELGLAIFHHGTKVKAAFGPERG